MAKETAGLSPSPWHPGELALQAHAGVVAAMDAVGRRSIRDHLIEQHRQFYPLLPFIVVGAVDGQGDVWASLLAGEPGFLRSPDPSRLSVAAPRDLADPADQGLDDGDPVALLGIELPTRRRNRLNGIIRRTGAGGFDVIARQSYGNCPRYIHLRAHRMVRDPLTPSPRPAERLPALDEAARRLIFEADVFFVASYVDRPDRGREVDVSHRGGKPGFVRIGEDGVLTVPDFAGNLMFNTLGNFLENPKAGLVFVDFDSGELLQLTGDVEVVLDGPEIAAFQGSERLWRFRPRMIVRRPEALPLRWSEDETGVSPYVRMTGSWGQVESRLKAAELAAAWRPFRVEHIVEESTAIRSFHLEPADGVGALQHLAGQHVPIRLTLPGEDRPVIRTYTLSRAPGVGGYRISVKRDGRVSTHLHDVVHEGDLLELRAPVGGFTIDPAGKRPAVLLAAGVGITPMLAMLQHVVYEGLRTRRMRPTWLFQAARRREERAFAEEIEALVTGGQGFVRLVRVLSQVESAEAGHDYDVAGRIDMELLRSVLPFDDYDFYICGPSAFTQDIYDGLRGLNIANDRIHAEAFGPSALVRTAVAAGALGPQPAAGPTR